MYVYPFFRININIFSLHVYCVTCIAQFHFPNEEHFSTAKDLNIFILYFTEKIRIFK